MDRIDEFTREFSRREGKLALLKEQKQKINKSLKEQHKKSKHLEQATVILQRVAKETQQELEYRISEVVTLALAAVFPDPYTFKVLFQESRGKTQCQLLFVRDDTFVDPLTATGGGAVDVAAFALRIAFWSILRPLNSNTIVLDEPFRFLSKELQPKAAEMMKNLSSQLGIQIIMVTHNEELSEAGDLIFRIRQKNGISKIEKEEREEQR